MRSAGKKIYSGKLEASLRNQKRSSKLLARGWNLRGVITS